jgi:hypothetical protein
VRQRSSVSAEPSRSGSAAGFGASRQPLDRGRRGQQAEPVVAPPLSAKGEPAVEELALDGKPAEEQTAFAPGIGYALSFGVGPGLVPRAPRRPHCRAS